MTIDRFFANNHFVRAGIGIYQNKFHDPFDVYTHTQRVVYQASCVNFDSLEKKRNMKAAAWLHDIGKPVVAVPQYTPDGSRRLNAQGNQYNLFRDHEIVGSEIVRRMSPRMFKNLGLNQDYVASIVLLHGVPMRYIKDMRKREDLSSFKEIYLELIAKLKESEIPKQDLLDFFLADQLGHGLFAQLAYAIILIYKLIFGVSLFGFIFNFSGPFYIVVTLILHLSTLIVLLVSYKIKPRESALFYSLIFLTLMYLAVILFTSPHTAIATDYNFIYYSKTFSSEIPYYTQFWVLLSFLVVVLPTYLFQKVIYFLYHKYATSKMIAKEKQLTI